MIVLWNGCPTKSIKPYFHLGLGGSHLGKHPTCYKQDMNQHRTRVKALSSEVLR